MSHLIANATKSLHLIEQINLLNSWFEQLNRLVDSDLVDHHLKGKVCRLLLDAQYIDNSYAESMMNQALSQSIQPEKSAAWLEGVGVYRKRVVVDR